MGRARFPVRASGPAERLASFLAHLRLNGLAAGPGETRDALDALATVDAADPHEARLALKTLLARDAESWAGFDALFDAYWFSAGRERRRETAAPRRSSSRPALWSRTVEDGPESDEAGTERGGPDDGAGEAAEGEGRRLATRTDALTRRDLRRLVDPDEIARAEAAALRLARAIRDRRSRRRRAARRGAALDMARVLRRSLARGGDPVDLARKRRPERPMRLVVLCDVSGSMEVHARVFLAFVRGLVSADARAQAFLFHTRLVAITAALAERDPFRAATRLSLMAEGFGGGTDIGGCLTRFCEHHAARAVNGRTVVVILSDGYCSGAPEAVGGALARLGRRAGRIVWLSPLDADPAPAAIEAARPRLDALLFATTIDALGALEAEFARL